MSKYELFLQEIVSHREPLSRKSVEAMDSLEEALTATSTPAEFLRRSWLSTQCLNRKHTWMAGHTGPRGQDKALQGQAT